MYIYNYIRGVMKLFIITAIVLLQGCGSYQFPEQTGTTTQDTRIASKYVKRLVDNALASLHNHPTTKTRGISSNLFADKLNIHPAVWGRYVDSDSALVTRQIKVDGKVEKVIFATGFTPSDQIAGYLKSLDSEMLKQGVPITQVGDNVSYKQGSWSFEGFHSSIGQYLDRKTYVTRRINVDGRQKSFIFAIGFTPDNQIAGYLKSLDSEILKRGVPMAQVGDNVSYKQGSWSFEGFHISIGEYLDRKKYVTRYIVVDGRKERLIFSKGFTPSDQIAGYLKSLDSEILKRGVPIAQVGDNVSYKQGSWSFEGFHISIGEYLDRKKYVTRYIVVDGRKERLIFSKGFTPSDQIAGYLKSLDPEILKRGVPMAQVGDNVAYKQDSWSREGFYISIGQYLDRKKYVTRYIVVDERKERLIFTKGFTPSDPPSDPPSEQIDVYLKNLDPEMLKQGVPIAQVGDNVAYKQDGLSLKGFYTSIGQYLDRKKYATRRINVDGRPERFIFAIGFTPSDQITRYLESLDPEVFKQGVPIAQVGDNVAYKQDGKSLEGFHISIGQYLDRKKYVPRLIKVDGKVGTYIFATGFTPSDQIAGYLKSLDPKVLKQGVPVAQVGDNVAYKQEAWSFGDFHQSIGLYLDKKKYVTHRIVVDGMKETYIFAK